MQTVEEQLYDRTCGVYLIGCCMHNPNLRQSDKYSLTAEDFNDRLHNLIFKAIFDRGQQNGFSQAITPANLDRYLKSYAVYPYYQANQGLEFTKQCWQRVADENIIIKNDDIVDVEHSQFPYYYNLLKVFTTLRNLYRKGIDIKDYYNVNDPLNNSEQFDKLVKLTPQQILSEVRARIEKVEEESVGKKSGDAHYVNYQLKQLIESLQKHPEVGRPLNGKILNDITRGARMGKFYIYSAPSGEGKTRFLISNACAMCFPHLDEKCNLVFGGAPEANETHLRKAVYIATEQQLDEIQTLILAYVSGVKENRILDGVGAFTQEEAHRIELATKIIDQYYENLIVDCITDPNTELLKNRLNRYIADGAEFIFYDYIFTSPSLINKFASSGVREDVVLMMRSNTLKEIAAEHNVFIMSATQLNDNWSNNITGPRNQNCIRGSKAIADKVDVGLIGIKARPEELNKASAAWSYAREHYDFVKELPEYIRKYGPNQVVDIYKNRRGQYSAVKLFRYFDYATCRGYDLFRTDCSYGIEDTESSYEYLKHTVSEKDWEAQHDN